MNVTKIAVGLVRKNERNQYLFFPHDKAFSGNIGWIIVNPDEMPNGLDSEVALARFNTEDQFATVIPMSRISIA